MASSTINVKDVLAKGAARSTRKSVAVNKEDDLEYDLGRLYAYDPSPIDEAALRANESEYLMNLARDNLQLLTNKLYDKMAADGSKQVISLPAPTFPLPREKPLPQGKETTRWERYAKTKGIVKKKRSKMVWDEDSKTWAPRFGYGRAKSAKDSAENWVVEAKPGDDVSADPFAARADAKKAKLGKQKRQEERNRLESAHAAAIATSGRSHQGGAAASFRRDEKKAYLKQAISAAQTSTASAGRFDRMLPNEPSRSAGKRKQYSSATSAEHSAADASRAAKIANKMYAGSCRRSRRSAPRLVGRS
jgi:regulator of ribosome biosynthesis